MRNHLAIMFAVASVFATGASAQATGTVRTNTLTQTKSTVTPEPKEPAASDATQPAIKADGDKTLKGEIPIDTKGVNDPKDVSAVGSPVPAGPRGVSIAVGTDLSLQMDQPVSSSTHKNGQMVDGVLLQPVRLANGTTLAKGTPVKATVLAVAPAGKIQSAGVLSLEVVRVGNVAVNTNVVEFSGQRGHAEVADANPAKGTEAIVQPGAPLQFKVLGAGNKADSSKESASQTERGVLPKR